VQFRVAVSMLHACRMQFLLVLIKQITTASEHIRVHAAAATLLADCCPPTSSASCRFQVAARQAQDVRQLFLEVSAALCGLPLAVTAGAVCTSTAAGAASCPEDLRGGGDDAAPDGVGDSMQHMRCWSWSMMCMRGSCCR
jgi:hypothetical protein